MFTNALFKWAAIGLLVVCIGLGITVWIQKGIIKEQGETIGIQKTEIARLNGELEKKEKDIERLNSLADKNAQNLKEAQIRMGQILAMSSQFKTVPLTPQTQTQLGVISKKDSDKVIDWINKEILK